MNYTLEIKKAKTENAKAIYNITKEAFKKYIIDAGVTVKLDALEEKMSDIIEAINTQDVFIALADGIPVGTIRIEIKADKTAFISRFGVMPENQKNGIGRSLMSFSDNFLSAKQVSRVSLYTASKHTELILFYYRNGFYIDSTTKDRGYIRALMVKEYQNH